MESLFNLENFVSCCQKSGLSFTRTKQALDSWAKSYEGLTKEEIYQKASESKLGSKVLLNDDWFKEGE